MFELNIIIYDLSSYFAMKNEPTTNDHRKRTSTAENCGSFHSLAGSKFVPSDLSDELDRGGKIASIYPIKRLTRFAHFYA